MRQTLALAAFLVVFLTGCASRQQNEEMMGIDTGVNPEVWALIPAGAFLQGQEDHEILVDYDYEIMVTDVTNQQYANYLNEALAEGAIRKTGEAVIGFYPGDIFDAYEHELEIAAGDWLHIPLNENELRLVESDGIFDVKPGYQNHPMTMVTWFGAKAYCEYHDWRLPTEVEWEKAARGTDNRPYPWGDQVSAQNANYYSSHDLFEKIVGGLGDTTPVGFYNGKTYAGYKTLDSRSPYGLYDMAGNVWQWTGDIYSYQHYRYMRGGSKADYSYNLRIWMRNSAGPDYYSINVGFRCARDVAQ